MHKLSYTSLIVLLLITSLFAVQRKALVNISSDALTSETQASFSGTEDSHFALAWWIPNEFWDVVLSQDKSVSQADKQSLLNSMKGISLLAVVQADISGMGAFNFYSKSEVSKKVNVSFRNSNGKTQRVTFVKNVNPNLEMVLAIFKPILKAAMGNMGNNMHFYVLDDKSASNARLLNPYKKGNLSINLSDRKGKKLKTNIEFPLNSLFIARKCPNGKDAHISWDYCPWTGSKLPK